MAYKPDITPEAVEAFIQSTLKEAVLSEGMPRNADDTKDAYATVALLRALRSKLSRSESQRVAQTRTIAGERKARQAAEARVTELEAALSREKEENRWAYVNAALEDNALDAKTARNDALRAAEVAMRKECTPPDGTYDMRTERDIAQAEAATIELASRAILALIEGETND